MAQTMNNQQEDHYIATISETNEKICWGCGMRLLLPPYTPIFKCGWCGAITDQNLQDRCSSWWRRLRDRLLVTGLLFFMLFVICGGIWAVYPVVFSFSFGWIVFHLLTTVSFSIVTIVSFISVAFQSAASPLNVLWGSLEVVRKGALENFTFCHYCGKPKSPRMHHCRTCGTCIMDMDHHCPFIGNCIGAANHHNFIIFLALVVISNLYAFIMSIMASAYIWPSLGHEAFGSVARLRMLDVVGIFSELARALSSAALLLSLRGMVLMYLCIASFSVQLGICLLLWQQLQLIYEGRTYINHMGYWNGGTNERGWQNIRRFFDSQKSVFLFVCGSMRSAEKTHKR
ncbi:protein S-acyltransferase 11 [Amborella trichopoda]|nr:protein S-acyltransferase 11 [Amborella trichopoda]XP_020526802.1 protein S-acyltransferase 11 [Amborella trichopoda]XP_020526803.1 protein S-acyltransferase 11 [Amborella trichopoda]XP_020526804.1 protein S-acyltransferase 11 [Amborella trichopoda]XP_020526805.1 protein S-acyltransferase 11 [Amborella trichopoda]XP_020526806.1 protein S-acyltransferase 11 [Amborella trichopoda]|eukprot:XP_006850714.2 protein S-acyltransferase 11 [Amborella trichopoda]